MAGTDYTKKSEIAQTPEGRDPEGTQLFVYDVEYLAHRPGEVGSAERLL